MQKEMPTEVTLDLTPEQLNQWLKQGTTKKVLQFLAAKQQEVVKDWTEGNYRSEGQTLEDVGVWTLTMAAQQQAYSHMLNLQPFLNPDLCSDNDK